MIKDLKQNVRKTAKSNVLLAFKISSIISRKAFQEAVQKIVKEKGKISLRMTEVTLEVRDIY